MARFVVIRDVGESSERLVPESAVPTEASLHEVLMRHPALVPATDLGFGSTVTVGYEARLESGSPDLVLLDAKGRLCIVEVKKAGNRDTRQVVAQLLDYGAALWGMSVEDFERDVLQRRLGVDDPRTLRQFVAEELVADADDPKEAAERTLEQLGETLRSGHFALVVAAPEIPAGVHRVIEYLNARGQSVFGLEVSYFAGEVEAFVPRVVVRPTIGGRIAAGGSGDERPPVDPETYIRARPEAVQRTIRAFVDEIGDLGGELDWMPWGARVRVRGRSGPRVMVSLDEGRLWIAVGSRKGLNPEHGVRAAEQLREVPSGQIRNDWGFVPLDAHPQEVEAGLRIARELVRDLTRNRKESVARRSE